MSWGEGQGPEAPALPPHPPPNPLMWVGEGGAFGPAFPHRIFLLIAMIALKGMEITYKWSPRRKSIALKVTVDGRLEIQAPRGTSQARIYQAIEKHRAWIHRKAAERKEAWNRLQDGVAFFLGQPYSLTVVPDSQPGVELRPGAIRVGLSPQAPSLWPQLRDWYRRQAEPTIRERVGHYAPRMALKVGPAQVREWRSRWGECHPQNGLRFNWRLVMLPPEVLDYVVVHELAHLKVPGHPPEFWRQVGAVLPDYARRRQWLNHYGSPFLLWQPGGKESLEGGPGA